MALRNLSFGRRILFANEPEPNIEVLPRPSTLSRHVTDSAFRPISDDTVLLHSDIEMNPGGSNTLQLSTDARAFYETGAIPPHVYQISATQSSFVPAQANRWALFPASFATPPNCR